MFYCRRRVHTTFLLFLARILVWTLFTCLLPSLAQIKYRPLIPALKFNIMSQGPATLLLHDLPELVATSSGKVGTIKTQCSWLRKPRTALSHEDVPERNLLPVHGSCAGSPRTQYHAGVSKVGLKDFAVILGRHFKFAAAFPPGKNTCLLLPNGLFNSFCSPKALHQNHMKIQRCSMFHKGDVFLKKFIWRETKHDCYKNILCQLLVCLEASSHLDISGGGGVGLAPGLTGRAGQPPAVRLPQLHQSNNPWQKGKRSLQKNMYIYHWTISLYPWRLVQALWHAVPHLWTLNFAPLVMFFGGAVTPVC